MRHALPCAAAALALLAACDAFGPKARTSLEITTRDGTHLLVVDAKVNYLRVCYQSTVDAFSLTEYNGLRLPTWDAQKQSAADVIAWKDLDSIDFGKPVGDIGGDFCPGQPEKMAAQLRLRDGSQQQRELEDTTDEGVFGPTERGEVTVPLHAIASLKVVKDEHWPWSESQTYSDTVLHLTDSAGQTRVLDGFDIDAGNASKQHGDDSLISPFGESVTGFPVYVGGARLDLSWNLLKSVEFEPPPADGGPQKAKLTFTDGHSEEFTVRDGRIGSGGALGVSFRELKRIDVESKPQAPLKSS